MPGWKGMLASGVVIAGFGGMAFGLQDGIPFLFRAGNSNPPAIGLWEKGQKAIMDGQPDAAVRLYKQSLAADPALHRNHLSLAAAYLEMGKDDLAAAAMERYLDHQPDHLSVRQHYGELLIRSGRIPEARMQIDRFLSEAQKQGQGEAILLHAHSRLLEIAEGQDDSYEEHFHRGVGLYYLAGQPVAPGTEADNLPENLLCKAALQLNQAVRLQPHQPRPRFYLNLVWSKLGQTQPALQALCEAETLQWEGELTSWERSQLWKRMGAVQRTLAGPSVS